MIELLHLLSKTQTAKVTGRAPKFVTCEQCGRDYVYLLERKASGEEVGFFFQNSVALETKAKRVAEERLEKRLREDCEPVPCPECGWYQRHMLRRAAKLRYGWMGKWALVMLPIAVLTFFAALVLHEVGKKQPGPAIEIGTTLATVVFGAAAAGVILLPVARLVCGVRYDPNRIDDAERRRIGAELAVRPENVWRLLDGPLPTDRGS